jgi:hypothetical protein
MRQSLTFLADMISVPLARKSLIGSPTMTNSTVMTHGKIIDRSWADPQKREAPNAALQLRRAISIQS